MTQPERHELQEEREIGAAKERIPVERARDEARLQARAVEEQMKPAPAAPAPEAKPPKLFGRAARDRDGNIKPYRRGVWYWILNEFVAAFVRLYVRLEIRGQENIPREGGVLLLVNHGSYLDPPVVAACTPRQVQFLARTEVVQWPFFGWIMRTFNTHPIRREGIDRKAIALCRELIRKGWPLAIFPEGTRTPDGYVHLPKAGFAMILEGQGEPPLCVPIYLEGTHRAYGRRMKFPLPKKVRANIGEPFQFAPQFPGEKRRDFYERCVVELADRWRALGAQVVEDEAGGAQ